MPIVLFHVVWMPEYAGEAEVHAGGFDFVKAEGFGHELLNFMASDEYFYGYVQSRSQTINIDRLGADPEDTFVDDCDVVWTATSPNSKKRFVVGWYLNARVFRKQQFGNVGTRMSPAGRVGFYAQAPTKDCKLISENARNFEVPHGIKGWPGQSPVFYPKDSPAIEMQAWLNDLHAYMDPAPEADATNRPGLPSGWPTTPDAAHNALVEAAAIAFVRKHLGHKLSDRQKDNCGWDLEFQKGSSRICVEVKGLSGTVVRPELSPNEYAAMKRAMNGTFTEGKYNLAIVCSALTNPQLYVFSYLDQSRWICERTAKIITVTERIAAFLN